jgi:hypothetical protein
MWLKENQFAVRLGGNTFINVQTLITFRDEPLFTLYRKDDGYLAIDFAIYDQSGQKIASVKKSNIYVIAPHAKTHSLIGNAIRSADRIALVEKASGAVLAEIRKREAAAPVELAVSVRTYLPNGVLLDAGPNSINLAGGMLRNNTIMGCRVGIAIGDSGIDLGRT